MAKRILWCGIFAALALTAANGGSLATAARAGLLPAVQELKTRPLYRFHNSKGYLLYSVNQTLPKGGAGDWQLDGVICHVPAGPNHQVPAIALRQFAKSDDYGERYLYAKSISVGGWTDTGIAFYVATLKSLGAVPLYQLYKPFAKSPKQNVFDKINEAIYGIDEKTPYVPKEDGFYYTPDEQAKASAIAAGYQYQGIVGYVWLAPYPPPPAPLPDLAVVKTSAEEFSVTATIANRGRASTGGAAYDVSLVIFDSKGQPIFKKAVPAPGLSVNQLRDLKLDTGGNSLLRKRYQVRVDPTNRVEESNEANNETAVLDGSRPLIIPKGDPEHVPPPHIELIGVASGPSDTVSYTIRMFNWERYAPEWFQQVSPNFLHLELGACDGKVKDARMIARFYITKDGKAINVACRPLLAADYGKDLSLSLAGTAYANPETIYLVLTDRLVNVSYQSNAYTVGAFGLDKLLLPLGCKRFLGNENRFLCTKKMGFDACESVRKKGVAVTCKYAGPPS